MGQQPDLSAERRLWAQGYQRIAGIDEAGRGAWAGPVVAAAVIFPPDLAAPDLSQLLTLVRDSKLLTPRARERAYDLVVRCALACGVGVVSAAEIDQLGILPATRRAMIEALSALSPAPQYLLIDAVPLPQSGLPYEATFKADARLLSVAAASIVAKVTRDRALVALDRRLPGYALAQHKGYGTVAHQGALLRHGSTPHHRHSYAPIQRLDAGLGLREGQAEEQGALCTTGEAQDA